jgi:hypothetical protein
MREHLVSSDKAIIAARKLLLKAINDLQEGREPQHMVRDPSKNHFPHLQVISEILPTATDVRCYLREIVEATGHRVHPLEAPV